MMFTKRHERELAEIRAHAEELDRRVMEALERIERIKIDSLDHRGIRSDIDALARRYELPDGAADALEGLVRLVDWGRANFVPRSDSNAERDGRGLRAPSRRVASSMLAESLSGLELEPVRAAHHLADIGSGGGFPGLVLAIALPEARVTLIEPKPERFSFLRRAAAKLGLDNVEVFAGTVQEWSEGAGVCDIVTARKVGRPDSIVKWSAPLLAPGGAVALWPGSSDFGEEEAAALATSGTAAGLRLAQVLPIQTEIKGNRALRHLYLFQKHETRFFSQRRGDDSLVAFVHIPKTAGGTITSMLADAYSLDAIGKTGNYLLDADSCEEKVTKLAAAGWETWRRQGGRVAVGHTPYGVFQRALPPLDTRFITFLREPVDRVLSHYYRHIQRRNPRRAGTPKDLASPKIRASSLEEALVEMRLAALGNLATRFLCNDPSRSGDLPGSALEEAKANLREFAFVGIQERFEESVVLLQRTLGLEVVSRASYESRHVSIDRPTVEELSDEQRTLIEERNELDAELYAFALGLFEDALGATDEGFAADVETLRASSADAKELPAGR